MKQDMSAALYCWYFNMGRQVICRYLRNGYEVTGVIAGFFRGDGNDGASVISRRRLTASAQVPPADAFGYANGACIKQEDIVRVRDTATGEILIVHQ